MFSTKLPTFRYGAAFRSLQGRSFVRSAAATQRTQIVVQVPTKPFNRMTVAAYSMGTTSGTAHHDTMIAYRFAPGSRKPSREEIPIPIPKPNEVLVKVLAGGVCHTDVGVLDPSHNLSGISPNHYTLGHEGAGEIVGLGSAIAALHPGLSVGTYVVVFGANGCFEATCRECSLGMDNLCPNTRWVGLGRDGSWAEYSTIPASACVPVPGDVNTIPPAVVAVATDAVLTPYHALKTASRVRPEQTVLCIGVGGLGLNGVAIAKNCLGASTVIACDSRHQSLNQAREVGADYALTPEALLGFIREHGIVVDVVADFCGTQQTFDLAQAAVAAGGIVHIIGLIQPTLQITPLDMMMKDLTVKVTFWGCKQELAEVLQAIKDGKIKPKVETRALDECEQVLEEMVAGKLKGRIALIPPP